MKPVFAILFALVGIVLIYYGIMPLRLGITMGLILVAIGALFLTAVPASFFIKARWPEAYRVLRIVCGSVLAFGAVLAAVACVQIASRDKHEDAPENSVVVVLGAGLSRFDHLTPSLTLMQRLDTAAGLLGERPDAVCVVSGGQGEQELVSEAFAMRAYLVEEKGVDPRRIYMEDLSKDTKENLFNTARLMREEGLLERSGGNIALVTSGFHEFRACHFAQAAGLTPYARPAPLLAGLHPMYWLREALAVVVEVWLGV